MSYLIDYHMHTTRCNHARGSMDEYVKKALSLELKEIGFSDHLPLTPAPDVVLDRSWAMEEAELPSYIKDVARLKAKYPNIEIKTGIEADFFYGKMSNRKTKELLERYSWDYVIGSVHHLGAWAFDSPNGIHEFAKRDLYKTYENYFEKVIAAAFSGMYDILGHIDIIKKHGYVPEKDLSSLYFDVAKEIKKSGLAFEVNTAGLRAAIKEIYPAKPFLKALLLQGVPVTLGSDSHQPCDVGKDFNLAVAALKRYGVKEIATFDKRQRKMIPFV